MAIASNRTKSKDITSLVSKEYISATDTTKDTPGNTTSDFKPIASSSKRANTIGKKNAFSNTTPLTPGNELLGASIFPVNGDPSCDQGYSNRPKYQDDRLLSAPNKYSTCNTNPESIALRSVLDHVTEGLPEYMVVAIEVMVANQVGKAGKGIASLGVVNKTGHVMKGVASVSMALSDVGSTLKEKTNLKSLLNCMLLSGHNDDQSDLIRGVVLTGLLAQALCMGVNKLTDTLSELVANKIGVSGALVKGVVMAFISAKHNPVAEKMALLAGIETIVGGLSSSDVATTAPQANMLMKSIAAAEPTTQDPNKEYTDTVVAMKTLDPSWGKDSSGTPNMSNTKGNGYLKQVSSMALKSTGVDPANILDDPIALASDSTGNLAKLIAAANLTPRSILNGADINIADYAG